MRLVGSLLLAATLAAVVASPIGVRAEDSPPEPEYVLYSLGAADAVAVNDAGQVVLIEGADASATRTFLGVLNAQDELERRPVPGITGGYTLGHAVAPNGDVYGICHAGSTGVDGDGNGTIDVYYDHLRAFCAPGSGGPGADIGAIVIAGTPDDGPYDQVSEAFAVNAAGTVVGESGTPSHVDTRAVVFGEGLPVALSSSQSTARGINAAGKIVGWTKSGFVQRVALWHQGRQYDIDLPTSFSAAAYAINDHDQIVGSRLVTEAPNPPYNHAFLARLDGTALAENTDLGLLPGGRDSAALAINDAGVVVGHASAQYAPNLYEYRAVRWKAGVIADLAPLVDPASPGIEHAQGDGSVVPWKLTAARGINSAGEIVCTGKFGAPGSEEPRSFLLRPKLAGLVVSPRVLDFGDVLAGASAESSVRVTNGTAEPVTIRLAKPAKPFSLVSAKGFVLAPGAHQDVKVRVLVTGNGDVEGAFRVSSDVASPTDVTLRARGVPPIDVSRNAVSFGDVRGVKTESFEVTNRRDAPLTVKLSGLKKPFELTGPTTLRLPPRGIATVEVTFTNRVEIRVDQSLVLTPAGSKDGIRVDCSGVGTETAKVFSLTPGVRIRRADGTVVDAVLGEELGPGTELLTDIESEAVLAFPDGTVMRIQEMSQILIADLLKAGNRQTIRMNLKIGEVAATVNPQKTFKCDFHVTVPGATTSVRGTTLFVRYDDATQTSTTGVSEGSVFVTPTDPAFRKAVVKAGFLVRVTPVGVSALEPYVP